MPTNLSDSNASDALDRGLVSDIYAVGIANATLNVGTSQVEVRVGVSRLTNRKCVVITNLGSGAIYWGATGVTSANGTPINKSAQVVITVGDIAIFMIATGATNDVRIVEFA